MDTLWTYFWAVLVGHAWAVVFLGGLAWFGTKRALGVGSEAKSARIARKEEEADRALRFADPAFAREVDATGMKKPTGEDG